LSYGTPEAFGAIELRDVNASTISVATYGIILYTALGMGRLLRECTTDPSALLIVIAILVYVTEMVFIKPKKKAAISMRIGFH
jgi:hypothetical protein